MQGVLGMRNIISVSPTEKPPAGVFQQYRRKAADVGKSSRPRKKTICESLSSGAVRRSPSLCKRPLLEPLTLVLVHGLAQLNAVLTVS